MREESDTSILFISHGPPALLTPFPPPGLLYSDPYPALASAQSFSPTLLCSDFHFPRISGCLRPFSASDIASDAHPTESAAELQFHRRILALGLTGRVLGLGNYPYFLILFFQFSLFASRTILICLQL